MASSGSTGWLGSLTSRKSESELGDGVELQRMASTANEGTQAAASSRAHTQPVDIPLHGAPAPGQPAAAIAAAERPTAATEPSSSPPRPGLFEHPLAVATQQPAAADSMARYSSIGLDLPSALTVPAIHSNVGVAGDQQQQQQQQQQEEQQQPDQQQPEPPGQPSTSNSSSSSSTQQGQPTDGTARPSKVSWLPGLSSGVLIIPAGSPTQQQDGNSKPGPQQAADSTSSKLRPQAGNTAAAEAAAAGLAAAAFTRKALYKSGNEQLDKYLNYLLREHHAHKHLYYPGWGISDDGCAAVGDLLRRDRRLKVATLADNGIRDDGVELIADGLASNNSLLTLDLSGNKIGNAGAIALAEALHSNKALVELNLSNNRIGDDGAEALTAAAASGSSLKKLHLTGNLISPGQLSVVQHVLKTREYKMAARPNADKAAMARHMRKSSSLQFVIELSEGSQDLAAATASQCRLLQLPPATAIAALTEPTDTSESSVAMQAAHLLAELHSAAADGKPPDGSSLVCLLALRLAWRGYDVVIRTCSPTLEPSDNEASAAAVGGGVGGGGKGEAAAAGCAALRHSFVLVMQPGEASSPLVVDPGFRDLFVISHPTERYKETLDALPRTLVLLQARLYHLVEALCNEMAAAFQAQSLAMPPWRGQVPMLDKFFSATKTDLAVEADMSAADLQAQIQ